ncbi:MAG: hypothetical protein HRU70_15300 [Phycisphaeraceae bacterium]|nr:MAG: hypothetical protein HRU70_15300 [Phycisphaeraceae bacterium]
MLHHAFQNRDWIPTVVHAAWLAAALLAVASLVIVLLLRSWASARHAVAVARLDRSRCPACDYTIDRAAQAACPECGVPIPPPGGSPALPPRSLACRAASGLAAAMFGSFLGLSALISWGVPAAFHPAHYTLMIPTNDDPAVLGTLTLAPSAGGVVRWSDDARVVSFHLDAEYRPPIVPDATPDARGVPVRWTLDREPDGSLRWAVHADGRSDAGTEPGPWTAALRERLAPPLATTAERHGPDFLASLSTKPSSGWALTPRGVAYAAIAAAAGALIGLSAVRRLFPTSPGSPWATAGSSGRSGPPGPPRSPGV